MRRYVLLALLGCAPVGCRHVHGKGGYIPCPDDVTTVTAPAPRVEIQTPETVVVKAPTPNYGAEDGEECASAVCPTAGAGRHRKHACNPPAAPMYYPPYGAAPPGYGAAPPGYGAGMIGGEIKDRTAIGVTLETIRIPIPWPRLRAIPQPSEVTFRSQMINQPAYGNPVMMPMGGYGGPPVAYGAAPPMPQYGAPPPAYPPPGYGAPPAGGQVVVTGHQAMPVTGYMPVNVPAAPTPAGYGAPPPGAPPYCPPPDTAEQSVEKLKQKMKECEDLKKKIEELKKP